MSRSAQPRRPRVGVVKFASCDGCQLTLLNLEDELLAVAEKFDLVEFPEARSARSDGPFDVLFVEGSVSTPEQIEHLVQLRARAGLLVTIGACATSGGIQALRNWADEPEWRASVYAQPEWVESLATSTPISDHVHVDHEIHGCPVDPGQMLEALTALATGRRAQLPNEAVCTDCKRRDIACVLVSEGLPCLGPVTRTGCGAICPAMGRACYGCFGPRERANVAGLQTQFRWQGRSDEEVRRLFRMMNVWAEPFRTAASPDGEEVAGEATGAGTGSTS